MNPELAFLVVHLLETRYGRQTRYSTKGPLEQLIATLLSQRTNYADETLALNNLRERYGHDWATLADAPTADVEAAIQAVRFPEIKAPRLQEIIRRIVAEHGSATLDFLYDWPTEKIRDYLMALPGVGYKTSNFVLLFTLRRVALPVDTHVHRVSVRTGILPLKTSLEKAHVWLLDMLPKEPGELLNFHKLLFRHGQDTCQFGFPKCGQCVLRDHCRAYATKQFAVMP